MRHIRYPHYQSYLLRFWQESAVSPWRVSLHSIKEDKTVVFGELESLLLFLLQRTNPFTASPPSTDDSQPNSQSTGDDQ